MRAPPGTVTGFPDPSAVTWSTYFAVNPAAGPAVSMTIRSKHSCRPTRTPSTSPAPMAGSVFGCDPQPVGQDEPTSAGAPAASAARGAAGLAAGAGGAAWS